MTNLYHNLKIFGLIFLWILFISIISWNDYCNRSKTYAQANNEIHAHLPEKFYQEVIQKQIGGKLETILDDSTRIDIETEVEVIEVEFAHKWYEAVGQSLHYSLKTGKKPVIWLIKESDKDDKYINRCKDLVLNGVAVWQTTPNNQQGRWIKLSVHIYDATQSPPDKIGQ